MRYKLGNVEMDNTNSFTSGGVLGSLIRFAIPVLAAMFFSHYMEEIYESSICIRLRWNTVAQ